MIIRERSNSPEASHHLLYTAAIITGIGTTVLSTVGIMRARHNFQANQRNHQEMIDGSISVTMLAVQTNEIMDEALTHNTAMSFIDYLESVDCGPTERELI